MTPEIKPGSPEVHATIDTALVQLKVDRPVQEHAMLGGAKVLTVDEILLNQANRTMQVVSLKRDKGKRTTPTAVALTQELISCQEDTHGGNPEQQGFLAFTEANN